MGQSTLGATEQAVSVGVRGRDRPGACGRRNEDDIEEDLKEIGYEVLDSILQAHYRLL
jgi:hypothetical protein